jgi:hypothetical protein
MMRKHVDVFPAVVRLAEPGSLEDYTQLKTTGDAPQGTRRVDRTRAVVIENTLLIAQDSPEGPQVIFREQVQEMSNEGKTTHILTDSGKIIAILRDDNCGCGSRLRGWNPRGSAIVTSSEDPNA